MDFGGNQDKPSIKSSKQLDSKSFKDDLALGLFTLNKTLELNYGVPLLLLIDIGESLSLPVESLNILVKKKLYYIMVPAEEVKPKKKINGNVGEQNMVIGKRIKKQLKAYIGFLANITKD